MATDMEAVIARLADGLGEFRAGWRTPIKLVDEDWRAILTVLQEAKAYVDAREAQPAWDADFVLLDERYGDLVRAMKGRDAVSRCMSLSPGFTSCIRESGHDGPCAGRKGDRWLGTATAIGSMPDPESIPRKRIEELIADDQRELALWKKNHDHPDCVAPRPDAEDRIKALTLALAADGYREALERIVEVGTEEVTERVGDMYAEDGYRDFTVVSEEARIAEAALAAGAIGGKP